VIRVPPVEIIAATLPHLLRFLGQLGQLQVGPSLNLTSWYRDPATNARVGGAPQSQHLLGLAIDVDGDPAELDRFAVLAQHVGLTAVLEQSHLHIQALPAGRAAAFGLFTD